MSSKIRVLIVDDDANLSRLICLLLEKTQMYEVRVENHPAHAIAATREFKPGVMLLDVDMPGKSGGEIAREMQADPVLKYVKIIFITALVAENKAGMDAAVCSMRYLSKPVDPMTLIDTIEDVLNTPTDSKPLVA